MLFAIVFLILSFIPGITSCRTLGKSEPVPEASELILESSKDIRYTFLHTDIPELIFETGANKIE
jgi:hypothetical protein